MRNVIFGAIGVLWGGSVLLYSMFERAPLEDGAYGAGQVAGRITAVLLFGVGLFYLIQGIRAVTQDEPRRRRRKRKRRWPGDD